MEVNRDADVVADIAKNAVAERVAAIKTYIRRCWQLRVRPTITADQWAIMDTHCPGTDAKIDFCTQNDINISYNSTCYGCGTCTGCIVRLHCDVAVRKIHPVPLLIRAVQGRETRQISVAQFADTYPWGLSLDGEPVSLGDFATGVYNPFDEHSLKHERRLVDDTTPCIILTTDAGETVVLDGNHRICMALRNEVTTLPAYTMTEAELATCELSHISWQEFIMALWP